MPKRTTLYLSDAALAVIGPDPESQSGRINSIIIRYGEIVASATPPFSEAAWCAICDAFNGLWALAETAERDPARFLWAEMADSEADGIGEKWGVDVPDLAAELRALSLAEKIAVMEVVRKFWTSPKLNSAPNAELLRDAGVNLA